MGNLYAVAALASEHQNFEVVHGGLFSTADEARERAYEVQRCWPDRKVGILKLSEVVDVSMSTVLVP